MTHCVLRFQITDENEYYVVSVNGSGKTTYSWLLASDFDAISFGGNENFILAGYYTSNDSFSGGVWTAYLTGTANTTISQVPVTGDRVWRTRFFKGKDSQSRECENVAERGCRNRVYRVDVGQGNGHRRERTERCRPDEFLTVVVKG